MRSISFISLFTCAACLSFSDPADTIIHMYRRVTFAADLMRIDYMSRRYQEDIATSFTFTCIKKLPNNKFLVSRGDQSAQKRFTCIQVRCPVFHCKLFESNSLIEFRVSVSFVYVVHEQIINNDYTLKLSNLKIFPS